MIVFQLSRVIHTVLDSEPEAQNKPLLITYFHCRVCAKMALPSKLASSFGTPGI